MTSGRPIDRGWTYLLLLWWVAISGVMLMAIAHSWRIEVQRQRETELVFRGEQIRAALQAYHDALPSDSTYPKELIDLMEDHRGPNLKRHLRRLWSDPINAAGNDQWGLVRNEQGRIVGIYSSSEREPLAAPKGVMHYSDWRFMASALSP